MFKICYWLLKIKVNYKYLYYIMFIYIYIYINNLLKQNPKFYCICIDFRRDSTIFE